MRGLFHAIAGVLLLAASGLGSGDIVRADEGKVELVMFEEFGCEWCERWLNEIGPIYPKTSEGKFAPLRRVYISDERPADLKDIKGITYSPTFVLMKDGKEVGRLLGYPGQDFFWPMLDEILVKAGYTP